MITLSIDRASLGLLPLAIGTARTAGTYQLAANGWNPGRVERDNAIATSRWLSGGKLVSTRTQVISLELTVRVWASSVANMRTMVDDLGDALGQYSYQITETVAGALATNVYDCMPASYSIESDPNQWRQFTTLFTASIPREL
jgi:hypothetical protein